MIESERGHPTFQVIGKNNVFLRLCVGYSRFLFPFDREDWKGGK